MKEYKRRQIARKFLEKNFGKKWQPMPVEELARLKRELVTENGLSPELVEKMVSLYNRDFELWRSWDSMKPGEHQARAFMVFHAPYISGAEDQYIAVSDSKEELEEIVNLVFDKERIALGLLEYDEMDGYYVVYD